MDSKSRGGGGEPRKHCHFLLKTRLTLTKQRGGKGEKKEEIRGLGVVKNGPSGDENEGFVEKGQIPHQNNLYLLRSKQCQVRRRRGKAVHANRARPP